MKTGFVIGKTGQLARALAIESQAENINLHCFGRDALDLTSNANTLLLSLSDLSKRFGTPDFIIIAAAYTAVDNAETDYETALAVNGLAPGAIAHWCAQGSIPIVHISTDYVFQGTANVPYKPEDPTCPINQYGASKLAGEQSVLASQARCAILRTSWVYDGTGKNFLTTMLRLAKGRTELSIVDDQIGRPTYAGHLAIAALRAAKALCDDTSLNLRIHHVSNSGPVISWADFAVEIFDAFSDEIGHPISVKKILASQFPTPAKRPAYSVLNISSFEENIPYELPHWNVGINRARLEHKSKYSELNKV